MGKWSIFFSFFCVIIFASRGQTTVKLIWTGVTSVIMFPELFGSISLALLFPHTHSYTKHDFPTTVCYSEKEQNKKNRYQFLCQININNGSSLINVDWLCLSVKVNREVDGTLKCHLILLVLLTFFTANCQLILLQGKMRKVERIQVSLMI